MSIDIILTDILSDEGWNHGYQSEEKLEALRQIFEATLESIATSRRNVR
jgi:hypothetical protein